MTGGTNEGINLLPSALGVTVYAEIITIELNASPDAFVADGSCGRVCDQVLAFKIIRDLIEPDEEKTVKSALCFKGRSPTIFVPYYRDFNTNSLMPASYLDVIDNRVSIVYFHVDLSDSQRAFAMKHIGTHREILPSRMVR